MANAPEVHFGENSPQYIAWRLLGVVAMAEGKNIPGFVSGEEQADRKYILDTYAECLQATRDFRDFE